jgi:hypothetical protein
MEAFYICTTPEGAPRDGPPRGEYCSPLWSGCLVTVTPVLTDKSRTLSQLPLLRVSQIATTSQ